MEIRFLGAHNTETSTTRLPGILVDGNLALDAGSLSASLSLDEQLNLTAILLTHRHFDHVRDIPTVAMNCFLNQGTLDVYGSADVRESLSKHILNGEVYSRFTEKPFFHYHQVEPSGEYTVGGYTIKPIALEHSVPVTGYLIGCNGTSFFYSGDTGPGLAAALSTVRPDLIIVEVTASNRWTESMLTARHMTPGLLKPELEEFRHSHGYFPEVVTVHMNAAVENEIEQEIKEIAAVLGISIRLACEGLIITL